MLLAGVLPVVGCVNAPSTAGKPSEAQRAARAQENEPARPSQSTTERGPFEMTRQPEETEGTGGSGPPGNPALSPPDAG